MRALHVLLVACLVLALAACGGDDEGDGGGDGSGGVTLTDAPAEATPTGEATTATREEGGCVDVGRPEARPDGGERKPRRKLEEGVSNSATIKTNCGEFTIEIDAETSPNVAASFVSLARKGFYDGTVFHRIVPGFVIQGGDPTGTGSGGPGYSTRDAPPRDAQYTKGVVAMAKTGQEPAGTAGSQFFVVTGDNAGLPPDYAILGKVTDGINVVERIGALGDPATEQPTQTVAIESIEVREGR